MCTQSHPPGALVHDISGFYKGNGAIPQFEVIKCIETQLNGSLKERTRTFKEIIFEVIGWAFVGLW